MSDAFTTRIRTLYENNRWQGRTIVALLVLCFVVVTARVMLPYTIVMAATTWLEKQGIESSIEDVSFRIFNGEFSLLNAVGSNKSGPLFHIDEIRIHWKWKPLSEKTLVVNRINLSGLKLDVQQYSDAIVVAGIIIPVDPEVAANNFGKDAPDSSVAWAAELNEVNFSNIETCFEKYSTPHTDPGGTKQLDYCTSLSKMTWSGSIGYAVDKALLKHDPVPVHSKGDFHLYDFAVTDRLQSKSLLFISKAELHKVDINGLNNIRTGKIHFDSLSALQRDDTKHKDILRLATLTVTDVTFTGLDSLSIADIRIEAPGLYLVNDKQQNWEYEAWLPHANEPLQRDAPATTTPAADGLNIELGDISISQPDFCLNDAGTSQYYCLNISGFSWAGDVRLNTADIDSLSGNGTAVLNELLVRNRTLERNLVQFDKLSVSALRVNGLDDASIDKISLVNLAALQRTGKEDDPTIRLDTLEAKSITFRQSNSLHVAAISISEFGLALSINKDGSFEHDKWLAVSPRNKDTGETAAKQSKRQEQTLAIRLDELVFNTKQTITLTDNRYQPPVQVGFSVVNFLISSLDSSKPGQKSPFKLHTKTTRHGTIDIDGVVMPFRPKPSFDAKGKITGLDLRAVSAAVKKEIGHIIQSGQLDADLKLVAVDGQLDSNISLTLYHFNLQAVSNADAKALNDMFGMPINQSLMLLKDKNDIIKLSIPITGDINNPDFDPTDAIIKATAKATAATLITFYTPYGLTYYGGNILLDLATALRFDPLIFEAGKSAFTTTNTKQLDDLSKLLQERPQVHLTMCGMTNLADAHALFPQLKKTGQDAAVIITPEQRTRLEALARERQVNTKDYLVSTHAIDHSRLILCAPKHDNDTEAIGGVEISI